jgi:hypothetical protein
LINRQVIRVLSDYPSDRLRVKCDTGRDSVQLNTVEFLAKDYVAHMQHHLKKIAGVV